MSQRNWCVRLAIRRSASPKTGCACCAQCVSPPRSITRSTAKRGTRSWPARLQSIRSAQSVFAMTEAIMRRLRFSGAEIEATVEMVRQHMVFKDVPKMRVAKLKRFMARPTFDDELELHRVDCESSHRMLDNYEFLLRKREEFANEPIIPPPLLRGDDLIALGLKPGPKFGEILEAVETRQLEGTLRTREEALEWVKREHSLGRNE